MTRRVGPEEAREAHPLFDHVPPHNGRETSIAAAASVADHCATQRAAVLAFITLQPRGVTREEVCTALDISGDTVRPRVWELMRANKIRESGERRKTRAGRMAEVLVIA